MKQLAAVVVQLLLLFLFLGSAYAENDHIVKAPIDHLEGNKSCGNEGCHTRIRKEWEKSMHAHAVPGTDPIVNAFFEYLSARDYDTKQCELCHVPLKAVYSDSEKSSPVFDEGVTCVFCHSIYGKNDHPGVGINYYQINLNKFGNTPYQPNGEKLHDSEFIELFRSVNICAGCHRQGETDYILGQKRNVICQSCHMPSKQDGRSADTGGIKEKVYRHLFEGGHSETLLSMALLMEAESSVNEKATEFKLSITNDAYHTIPTGFPFRAVYVKVTALDENNNMVWRNFNEDPYKESPESYFGQVFDDNDDIFAHHARKADPVWAQLLPARSATVIDYTVPATNISKFEVKIYYRLLSEKIVKKLNLTEKEVPEMLMIEDVFSVD